MKSQFDYFNRHFSLLTIACISLFLTGCFHKAAPFLHNQDIECTSVFDNTPIEYSHVYDIGIPKQTGQSAIMRISLEDFQQISSHALSAYFDTCISCTHHDWHAIIIDSNVAIFYAYTLDHPIYGVWNDDDGITQILGDYLPSSDKQSYELSLRSTI